MHTRRHKYIDGYINRRVNRRQKIETALLYGVLMSSLLLGGGYPAQAAETPSDPLEVITRLYDAGDVQAAYEAALVLQAEWEGDPLFDLYFGLAAVDSGQLEEGLFALERILVVTPDDQQVRLEIARVYYLLGQLDRSRSEFETVLAADPPQSVRTNVASYLDAIKVAKAQKANAAVAQSVGQVGALSQATQVQAYVQVGMGWDTNVNSAPGVADFTTPTLGAGVLSANAVSDADRYTEFTLGASLRHALSRQWSVDLSVTGVARLHGQATAFDNRYGSVATHLNYNADALDLRLGVTGLKYYLDDARYQNSVGVSGEVGYRLTDSLRAGLFSEFSELTYIGQDDRNSQLKTQGLNLAYAPKWRWSPLFTASVYVGNENSDLETVAARSTADRDIKGASLGVSLLLSNKMSLNTGLQYQDSVYTGVNSVFLVRRHDEFHAANLGMDYQWRPNWLLRGVVSYSENRSNIEINRYYRGSYSLAVRHDFK